MSFSILPRGAYEWMGDNGTLFIIIWIILLIISVVIQYQYKRKK